ncbi:MAG: hypothetical protein CMP61_09350 [Flavobacteriales bacterium]|nr:hypothetical protein [Flavobacteriales bacterium]|tara:strand:- start:8508 stop:10943 length:2436 start_codon:yes stop_codon:yes gene_type:complete
MKWGLTILFFTQVVFVFAQNLQGLVSNHEGNIPIPYANISWVKNHTGTVANSRGEFSIPFFTNDSLVISAIGFQPIKRASAQLVNNDHYSLFKSSEVLNDVNIEITKKKIKRKRKSDPAYILHKKITSRKDENDLKKRSFYSCNIYNKIEVDLNNIDSNTKDLIFFKPLSFVFEHPDTVSLGKPFSPIFLCEGYSKYFYKNPGEEKELILASKNAGIQVPSIAQYTGNVYTDYNIYSNYIRLFQKQFVSPIAGASWLTYNFYLTDSISRGDTVFYRLDFKPRRKQDLAFEGYLITNNITHGVCEIEFSVPKQCNINFVEEFRVHQYYSHHDSIWLLSKEEITIDVNPWDKTYGFYVRKNTHWINYSFENEGAKGVFLSTQKTLVKDSAYQFGDLLLKRYRPKSINEKDRKIYQDIDRAVNTPYLKRLENFSIMAYSGYYPFKLWEYGPYYTSYSFNNVEGNRFRFSLQTTQSLLKKTRFRGHLAYGDLDSKWKYRGMFTHFYGFRKWRFVEFEYFNDYEVFSASNDAFQEDNILASLTRRVNPKYTFTQRTRLQWLHEWQNGLHNSIEIKSENLRPVGNLIFKTPNGEVKDQLKFNTITFGGRLALNERFVRYGFRRLSLNTTKPRFNYAYTHGFVIKNTGFEFHKLEIEMTDRYFLGFFGFIDLKIFVGKIWGAVPYPMLLNHRGNDSYYFDSDAFNLMNPFEFASDQQIGCLSKYNLNGLLFNRLPLIKRFNLRSFLFGNAVIGTLRPSHNDQILLPNGLSALNQPYFEAGFGIENIFKLLRLDFIWRLTNTNSNVQKFGITIDLVPNF